MRDAALLLALALVAAAAFAASLALGSTPMAPGRIAAALIGQGAPGDAVIVWQIRFPRALAAALVGAALGACGAAMQGLLRNPLAEPGVLGVSATASLCAVLTIVAGLSWPWATPIAAIAGALAATALLAALAARVGSVVSLILIGVGVSSFAGALTSLAMNLAPNPFSLFDLVNWMLGAVANRSLADIALSAPFLAAGFALLWATRRGLSVLTLGEEAAAGAGVNLAALRLAVVGGTGLAVGGATALAGAIGFVGLVAPHAVRPFVGHDPARTLAPAALAGAAMVLAADLVARLLPTPNELKLGVVAALIGAPAFVWIAARRGRRDG